SLDRDHLGGRAGGFRPLSASRLRYPDWDFRNMERKHSCCFFLFVENRIFIECGSLQRVTAEILIVIKQSAKGFKRDTQTDIQCACDLIQSLRFPRRMIDILKS